MTTTSKKVTAKKTIKKSVANKAKNAGEPKAKKAENKAAKPAKKGDSKDRSKLTFAGKQYGKGRVVQAVITKYLEKHPNITSKELEEAFPNNLHALGLVQPIPVAKKKSTNHKRYFLSQPLKLKDKTVAICSEFGSGNIGPFLKQAEKLGLHVKSKVKFPNH